MLDTLKTYHTALVFQKKLSIYVYSHKWVMMERDSNLRKIYKARILYNNAIPTTFLCNIIVTKLKLNKTVLNNLIISKPLHYELECSQYARRVTTWPILSWSSQLSNRIRFRYWICSESKSSGARDNDRAEWWFLIEHSSHLLLEIMPWLLREIIRNF